MGKELAEAAAAPPGGAKAVRLVRFVPRRTPWIGEGLWRRASLHWRQQIAPHFLPAWDRAVAGGEVAGINLYRQRKGESAPQLVNFFIRTPAVDPTPPASPGKSEERTYTARAVINGKEIGQPSDAVNVTVS